MGNAWGGGVAPGGYSFSSYMPVAAPATTEAYLVVTLPADATLTVDGHKTTSTSGQRTFVTTLPQSERTYKYTLTAEVTRDGKVETVTKQVTVRAGERTPVTLELPTSGVAE
jgi:uncharacterized protein (TIGR03000 family)